MYMMEMSILGCVLFTCETGGVLVALFACQSLCLYVWRSEWRLSELFCAVLCTEVVYSHKHTLMSSSYSSLYWVLSHWAYFTVPRFVYVCVFVFILSYCICVVYCCNMVGWPDGIEAKSLGSYLPSVLWHCWLCHVTRTVNTRPRYDLQCVCWDIKP